MDIVFKDVDVFAGNKQILHGVSGCAQEGEMLAILGPSGAGKTTLLNTLAGRNAMEDGWVTLNNKQLTKQLRRKICYVLQTDLFFPTLTLKETLTFTAMLRLPDKMPKHLKLQRVEDITDILELRKCCHTAMEKLSGGEQKRSSIGCELLTNPQVLLLDEPTSGLDAAIAFNVMKVLQNFCKRSGKTIVTTIHQPSSQIFHMFDNVMLLSNGKVAYFGRGSSVLDLFSLAGFHCMEHYNPADFIIEKLKESCETENRIIEDFLKTKANYVSTEVAECLYTYDVIETLKHRRRNQLFSSPFRNSPKNLIKKTHPVPFLKTLNKSRSFSDVRRASIVEENGDIVQINEAHLAKLAALQVGEHEQSEETEKSIHPDMVIQGGRGIRKIRSFGEIDLNENSSRSRWFDANGNVNPGFQLNDIYELQEDGDGACTNDVRVRIGNDGIAPFQMDLDAYYNPNIKWPSGFWTQYTTLTRRTMKEGRPRIWSKYFIIEAVFLAFLQGLLWFQLPNSEETIYDRMGLLLLNSLS